MASTKSNTSYRTHISAEFIDDHHHQHQTPLHSSHFTIVFKVFKRQSTYDRTCFAAKTNSVKHETTLELTHLRGSPATARAAVSAMLSCCIETPAAASPVLLWEGRGSAGTAAPVAFEAVVSEISEAAGSGRPGSRLVVTVEKRVAVVAAAAGRGPSKGLSRERVFRRSMDLVSLGRSWEASKRVAVVAVAAERGPSKGLSRERVFPRSMDLVSLGRSWEVSRS